MAAETWHRITDLRGVAADETVTVDDCTEKSVRINGRYRRMTSDRECFRRTRRECLEWLVQVRARSVQDAQARWAVAQVLLGRRSDELDAAQWELDMSEVRS